MKAWEVGNEGTGIPVLEGGTEAMHLPHRGYQFPGLSSPAQIKPWKEMIELRETCVLDTK